MKMYCSSSRKIISRILNGSRKLFICENVDNNDMIDFIKETHFYSQLQCCR